MIQIKIVIVVYLIIYIGIDEMRDIHKYKDSDNIAIAILNCAEKVDGLLNRSDMAKLLIGQATVRIKKYGFDHISEFGCLSNMDKRDVLKHIDDLIERGCLQVSGLFFPMIRLTYIGRKRLL